MAARYRPGYEPVLEDAGPSRFAASYERLMRGDDPYMFDCRLFGIYTREASVMDPQMRMLLTRTWEARCRPGPSRTTRRTGRTGRGWSP